MSKRTYIIKSAIHSILFGVALYLAFSVELVHKFIDKWCAAYANFCENILGMSGHGATLLLYGSTLVVCILIATYCCLTGNDNKQEK